MNLQDKLKELETFLIENRQLALHGNAKREAYLFNQLKAYQEQFQAVLSRRHNDPDHIDAVAKDVVKLANKLEHGGVFEESPLTAGDYDTIKEVLEGESISLMNRANDVRQRIADMAKAQVEIQRKQQEAEKLCQPIHDAEKALGDALQATIDACRDSGLPVPPWVVARYEATFNRVI